MDTEVTFKPVLPRVLCSTFAPCSDFPREAVSNKGVAATPKTVADKFLMNFRRSILLDNIIPPKPFRSINYSPHHSIINASNRVNFLIVLLAGMRYLFRRSRVNGLKTADHPNFLTKDEGGI
jgi:hypothetical protein